MVLNKETRSFLEKVLAKFKFHETAMTMAEEMIKTFDQKLPREAREAKEKADNQLKEERIVGSDIKKILEICE